MKMKNIMLTVSAVCAMCAAAETTPEETTPLTWATNAIPGDASTQMLTWTFTVNETPMADGRQTATIIKKNDKNVKKYEIPEYVYDAEGTAYYVTDLGNTEPDPGDGSHASSGFYRSSANDVFMPSVTNIAKIVGRGAFYNSANLTNIVARNVIHLGSEAFSQCTTLRAVDMPNVRVIDGSAFGTCKALKEARFEEARSIGKAAFGGCLSLKEARFDKVTSWPSDKGATVFSGCSAIEFIQVPFLKSFDGGRVAFFANCTNLRELVLVRFQQNELPNPYYTDAREKEMPFYKTSNLTQLKLPYCTTKFYGGYVTNYYIHRASPFTDETYRTANLKNDHNYGKNGVEAYGVTLYGNYRDDEATGIRWIYEYLPSEEDRRSILLLDAIKIPDTTVANAPVWGATTTIPETFEGLPVTTIQFGAFTDQTLERVKVPASVTEIRYGAFANCANLTEVVVPRALARTQGDALRESLDDNNSERETPIAISSAGGGMMIIVQ